MQGGRCDAESGGGFADGEQLSVGWLGRWLVGGDVAVASQPAYDDCGESLAGRGAAALAVEDPGDLGVGVVRAKLLQQCDCVLVGADRGLSFWECDGELGDRACLPADGECRAALLTVGVDDHFLDQAAQECFGRGRGRWRGQHAAEVRSEREERLALSGGERAGALAFAQLQFGFGVVQRGECLLPVALQAARDEAMLGFDLASRRSARSAW